MTRRLPLIAAVVSVLVLAGWFVVAWRPAGTRLTSARLADTTALARNAALNGQLSHLEAVERSLPSEDAKLERSLPALPVTLSADTVIDQINAIAQHAHIAWTNESEAVASATDSTSVTTTPTTVTTTSTVPANGAGSSPSATTVPTAPVAVNGGGASTLALTLTVSGRYTDMQTFLLALERQPRLMVISSLAYTPNGRNVTVAVTANAFYDPTPLPVIPKGVG